MSQKIAIVTGGASGIGKATTICLATKGAKVYVTDINDDLGKLTVKEIIDAGGSAEYRHLDSSKKADIDALFDQIAADEGKIDWLVNNAGIGGTLVHSHQVESSDWDRMIAINLTGVFYCMQAGLKHMNDVGGSIVNISSSAGLNGMARGMPYAAAKHGVIGLTKTAAIEYGKKNIRTNAVCPGFTETAILTDIPDMILEFSTRYRVPQRRLGTVVEIAKSIHWLLSDDASFINGHCLSVDGGFQAG